METGKTDPILVTEYSSAWPVQFRQLSDIYKNFIGEYLIGIEHVGSTAVPGLSAKPVLDIDLIVEDQRKLTQIAPILESLGYEYAGEAGIPDRHAFIAKSSKTPNINSGIDWPKHHLYCCIEGSIGLRNHLILRDQLRKDPELATAYGKLKKSLAAQTTDIDKYVKGKTEFITAILGKSGLNEQDLRQIEHQNKKCN